jgi:hypothetical protein
MSSVVSRHLSGKRRRARLDRRRHGKAHGYSVKKVGPHWLISIAGAGLMVCATRREALRIVRAAAELLAAPMNKA